MEKFNNSYIGLRNDLLKHIDGQNLKVFDVGCATGTNGKYLKDQKIANLVYGIEFDTEMASIASQAYDKVYVGDLNNDDFINEIRTCEETFDAILIGDILEHLIVPSKILSVLVSLLNKDGILIISVPNIQHIELFIQVYLKGTWPKNDRGIFDKTHLSWFTKKDIYALAESNGLKVINYTPNLRARDHLGSQFNFWIRVLKKINKNWFIFQHILICKKK